ncbi:hypothetical protein PIROE2DRAFT_14121, partial [Piromyces sp. E2]
MTTTTKSGLRILEEWNKINLGENTKNTCALLKRHYNEFNYPLKYEEYEDKIYDSLKSPVEMKLNDSMVNLFSSTESKTENNNVNNDKTNQELSLQLSMEQPIESTQQFFSWFSKIEEDMEKGQEDIYR